MIRPQNIKITEHCFMAWSSLSKILIPSTSLAPKITMFCSEFIMPKFFKPIKIRRHWPPFDFTSFLARPVLVLGCSLIRFHFFFWSLRVRNDSSMMSFSKSPFVTEPAKTGHMAYLHKLLMFRKLYFTWSLLMVNTFCKLHLLYYWFIHVAWKIQ